MKFCHYRILTLGALILFTSVGLWRLGDYGLGWDEPTRWSAGDAKLDYYLILFSGNPDQSLPSFGNDTYPGLFDLPLAAAYRLTGIDRMHLGHAFSLFFAVIGLIGTWWLAETIFGRKTALWSVLFLMLFPNFFGHAMMNPKDIPFLGTYLLGLAAVAHGTKRLLCDGKLSWKEVVFTGICIGLAGSTRLPGLVLLPMLFVCWGVALWRHNRDLDSRLSWVQLGRMLAVRTGVAGMLAAPFVFSFLPRLHGNWGRSLPEMTASLHTSAQAIPLLFGGSFMTAGQAPAYYAHGFFLISTPVWMLLLLLAGLVAVTAHLLRRENISGREWILKLLFLSLAAFPWVYLLAASPALHNGIRHVLFAIPPLVILMAFGFESLAILWRQKMPRWPMIPSLCVAILVAVQTVQLIRLHPYQYVSFNFLAGQKQTVLDRYEGEYWFTSTKHLLEALHEVAVQSGRQPSVENPIPVRVAGPLQVAVPFLPQGFAMVNDLQTAEFFVTNTTFRTDALAEGEVVYEIRRGGMTLAVIKDLQSGRMRQTQASHLSSESPKR